MAPPPFSIQRIHRALSIIGGCLVAVGVFFKNHLVFASTWLFSGDHHGSEFTRNLFEELLSRTVGGYWIGALFTCFGILFASFLVGAVITHTLTKPFLQSFFQDPSIYKGTPRKGFRLGFRCGFWSCVAITTIGDIAGIAYESVTHSISIISILLGQLILSIMTLVYVGLPVGILSGVIGVATELILRRMYGFPTKT